MSNKAAAAHPIQNETQPAEGFQVGPASSLSQLDEFQQLFADACQLGFKMLLLRKGSRFNDVSNIQMQQRHH